MVRSHRHDRHHTRYTTIVTTWGHRALATLAWFPLPKAIPSNLQLRLGEAAYLARTQNWPAHKTRNEEADGPFDNMGDRNPPGS